MAPIVDNKEKTRIEWELNCTANEAIDILSDSVENFIRPWFMTKTNLKGFILNKKFLIWPNTLYSGPTELVLTGKIIQNGEKSYLSATARILPPFNLFPSKQAANWLSGLAMFAAWLSMVAGLILENENIVTICMPIFIVTCAYNLIQFTKYIQKPELVDLKKRFHKIFSNHIVDS
jgi:hypothetical protein